MFERAGVRSCVGTFSSSIHVLSMAQSAKYTLHLLLASVQLYFAQLSTCTVSAIPRQGGCMLPSSSGIMMIHLLVSAAPGCAGQRSQDQAPSLWSQNLEPINCGEQQAGNTRLCTAAVLLGWMVWQHLYYLASLCAILGLNWKCLTLATVEFLISSWRIIDKNILLFKNYYRERCKNVVYLQYNIYRYMFVNFFLILFNCFLLFVNKQQLKWHLVYLECHIRIL